MSPTRARHASFFAIAGLLLFFAAGAAQGDPRADLASPSQEVRDKAAKILRETYKPPSPEKWKKLMESLKTDDPESKVIGLFHPLGKNGGMGMLDWVDYWYQLDDAWGLHCAFELDGGKQGGLQKWELISMTAYVKISPPAGFTGEWTTYYVNGQPFLKEHFKNGRNVGKYTFYKDDGSVRSIE